jgi:hypothetical protein
MDTHRLLTTLVGSCLPTLSLGLALAAATPPAAAAGYDSLTIVSPANEATIHDNGGRINIDAAISPPLRVDSGDRFVFIVDGVPMPPLRKNSLSLEEMSRGGHTLQVQVVDETGNALITSAPRTVYLWQASALAPSGSQQPQTQPPSQPPRQPPNGSPFRPRGL